MLRYGMVSSYDGKPKFLLWVRFVDRNDQQASFTSFVVCINQFEGNFKVKRTCAVTFVEHL